ncbi:hypothetical protein CASFOL_018133 [Castilleja foliolosa]|uniref:Uncharacterized protein n=1 Tax=Castilleja foliolosa TaxID=1961234 RepID=A0ABD3D5W9_9LAMI
MAVPIEFKAPNHLLSSLRFHYFIYCASDHQLAQWRTIPYYSLSR